MRRFDNRLCCRSGFYGGGDSRLAQPAQVPLAWQVDNFLISQIVSGFGFALTVTALVGSFVQNPLTREPLSNIRLTTTYLSLALIPLQSFCSVVKPARPSCRTDLSSRTFHSNILGFHVTLKTGYNQRVHSRANMFVFLSILVRSHREGTSTGCAITGRTGQASSIPTGVCHGLSFAIAICCQPLRPWICVACCIQPHERFFVS